MIECSGNGFKMHQDISEFQNIPRGVIPWTLMLAGLPTQLLQCQSGPWKTSSYAAGYRISVSGAAKIYSDYISAESMYNYVLYIAGNFKLGYAMAPGVNGDIKNSC